MEFEDLSDQVETINRVSEAMLENYIANTTPTPTPAERRAFLVGFWLGARLTKDALLETPKEGENDGI